eukprot:3171604-Prymnesium_polylepis.1
MIVSNLQSLRPLVAVVSLKRATIRPGAGPHIHATHRPGSRLPHADAQMGCTAPLTRCHPPDCLAREDDAKVLRDLGPGYVVN